MRSGLYKDNAYTYFQMLVIKKEPGANCSRLFFHANDHDMRLSRFLQDQISC